ncbi:prenyltransferase [Gandjariella thermophila]|uniref:Prenyltransferase n=1 Tax=Gandjariella thermophila TaxID=1931992 RepID=A0A4D4J2G4_9PSEU|nr:prenyltransferase [Gandjariella thermophila]GDY28978.1 prenyltransferase [Gandjariella thermophila]
MRRPDVPAVPGILTADDVLATARTIAAAQERSGAIPWFAGGHVDPWDHVESAMALSAAGLHTEAERAYRWLARTQRPNGSWPMKIRSGRVEDATADTNFCAYLAVGVWHHRLVTSDDRFAERMWPTVRRAIEFVLDAQTVRGEIAWARGADGEPAGEALLTGCASIHHSLRCALALADHLGVPQPGWEVDLGRLGHVLRHHPEAFEPKDRYSMDWYYPVLGGAVRGEPAHRRIAGRWADFVVPGLGIRCVDDHPWVTGAETCELALSLDTLGDTDRAAGLLADMQHLREEDGSYWTGFVFADGKRWPEERTTWTSAAVILVADALSRTSAGNGIFRAEDLPTGLAVDGEFCGCGDGVAGGHGSTDGVAGLAADSLEHP